MYPQGKMAAGDSNCYYLAMRGQPVHVEALKKSGYQHFFYENYESLVCLYDDYYKKIPRFW